MHNPKLNNLTILIVTYKSHEVIFKTLSKLNKVKNIKILDNSNDNILKEKVKKKYKNISFYLSKKNLGYGAGNNFLLKKVKTKYALILNPDCFINTKYLIETLDFANLSKNFAIIGSAIEAKIMSSKYKISKYFFYKCDYVKGFYMFIDTKKIRKIGNFDTNFFLYLEEIDLCKRAKKAGYNVIALKNIKLNHLSAKSSNDRLEFNKIRNWHWMWSQFYFTKKYKGYLFSFLKFLPDLILLSVKSVIKKNHSKYRNRFLGLFYSMINKRSFYRG